MDETTFHFKMIVFETVFLVVASVGYVLEVISLPGKDWYERVVYLPIEVWLDGETNSHSCHIV